VKTKATKSGPRGAVRFMGFGYYQDKAGQFWTVNPQTGWVKVPVSSRAFSRSVGVRP